MAKVILLLQILTYLLQLPNGMGVSSNSALWPDLSCHEGYIKVGQKENENGEQSIFNLIEYCTENIKTKAWGDESPECLKRCILEFIEILVYRVFQFQSEDVIAEQLNQKLFTFHPQTGKRIAKQILEGGCQSLLTALANAESKPSCEDQNEFMDCVQKAMHCK